MSKTSRSTTSTKYSFIAVADVHLGAKLFNLPELAQDLRDAFVDAVSLAIKLKVNYFIVVGDLYDHNKPLPDLVQFVRDQTDRLRASGVTPIAIAGDHDKPVNNSAWINLSGFYTTDICKQFLGLDYSDNSAENIQAIIDYPHKEQIEWIFLHGQVPELFPFCEEKKLLDMRSVDLINTYPNLKGVILGDIHNPTEGTIADPTQTRKIEPYIGYCGSLGVVRLDEIKTKIGVLYYDGKELTRVPFLPTREFFRINVKDLVSVGDTLGYYITKFADNKGKKPVFLIDYNRTTKDLLPKITKLYDVAIVRCVTGRKEQEQPDSTEVINLRSEIKTNTRVETILRSMIKEEDLVNLALDLINETEPKRILDAFKESILTEE